MLIAQITDLHLVEDGTPLIDDISTNAQLRKAVALLNTLDPQPDLVLATGDIAEHGTAAEYAAFSDIVRDLHAPVYAIPGNHDDRAALLAGKGSYRVSSNAGFMHYAIEDFPVRVLALDTSEPRQGYGVLCDARLDWLEETLSAAPERPTLIAMHHPPFRTGIRWIDAYGLHGGRRMETIVARHPQVKAVICGHVHRPVQLAWAGTIAVIASSTSHAQLDLSLTEADGYDCAYSSEPGTVNLYNWDPAYGIVCHTRYVGLSTKRYPRPRSEERLDVLRKRHAAISEAEHDVAKR
jgi:3',5'-cyclic AMP phosphodiesterase CpdA